MALLAILTVSTEKSQSNLVSVKVWEKHLEGNESGVLYDPATKRAAYIDGKRVFRLHATSGAGTRVFDPSLKPGYKGRLHVFGKKGFSTDFKFTDGKFETSRSFPDELWRDALTASNKTYVEVKGKREEHTVIIENSSQYITAFPHAGFYLVNKLSGQVITQLPLASQYYWSVIGNPSSGAYLFYGDAIFPEPNPDGFSTYVFSGQSELKKFRDAKVYDIDQKRLLGSHAVEVDAFPTYPSGFTMYALPNGKEMWSAPNYTGGILFGEYVIANHEHNERIDVIDAKTGKVLALSVFPPGRLSYTTWYTECFVIDDVFVQVKMTQGTATKSRQVNLTGWKLIKK